MGILQGVAEFALFLYFVYLLSRYPIFGLVSLLSVNLITVTLGSAPGLIGRIHLDASDFVIICLMLAGIVRTLYRASTLNASKIFAFGYLALFAVSLVRGLMSYGLFPVADEGRGFTAPIIAMLYFLTAPTDPRSIERYVKAYLVFGAALCIVAILAAAGLPVGMATLVENRAESINGRFLPAAGTAALAVCGFAALARSVYQRPGFLSFFPPVIYIALAAYLRHRTVWLMILVGIVSLLPLDPRLFRRVLPTSLLAVLVISVLVLFAGELGGLASDTQFAESAKGSDTWSWRVNGWVETVWDDTQTPLSVAIGKSLGTGYSRIDPDTGQFVEVALHNEYMSDYSRVGIVGTICVIFFILAPIVKFWRASGVEPLTLYPSTSFWSVCLVTVFVFGITYSIDSSLFALVGIANSISSSLQIWGMDNLPAESENWQMNVTTDLAQ